MADVTPAQTPAPEVATAGLDAIIAEVAGDMLNAPEPKDSPPIGDVKDGETAEAAKAAKAEAEEAGTPPPPEVKPPEPAKPPDPKEEAAVARGLAALALREKQGKDAHIARLAELKKREDAIAAREAKVAAGEKSHEAFLLDPVGTLKAMGIEKGFADIAKALWYEELGEDAPKEAKENRGVAELRRQMMDMRRQMEAQTRAAEQARVEAEQRASIEAYKAKLASDLPSLPESCKYVKKLASIRPERITQALMRAANAYAEEDPYRAPPTTVELAEMLEKEIAPEYELLLSAFAPPKTTATEAEEKQPPASKTLNNKAHSAPTQPREPIDDDDAISAVLTDLRLGKHLQA